MIIEARCNDCGKRIGYISIHGDIHGDTDGLEDIKYVKKVTYMSTAFTILCDECLDGRIDLKGDKP